MTNITLRAVGASVSVITDGLLTEHAVGVTVRATFDSAWNNLSKTGYARCGNVEKPIVFNGSGVGLLPWECLIGEKSLYIGVDGIDATGDIRIPTIWAFAGIVKKSVADNKSTAAQPAPTPTQVQQITAIAQSADSKAQSVVDRANAGEFKGEKGDPGQISEDAISEAVQDYLEAHPVEATVQSVNGQTGNVEIDIPSKVSQLENDAGYLTEHQDISGKQDKIADLDSIREGADKGATALQSESDPTVPAWAKQPNKPSYTAEEVGALPNDTEIPPAVTEQDIAAMGFTKGGYVRPASGIPASDLADGVVPDVQVAGESIVSGGVANIPIATSSRLGVMKANPDGGVNVGALGQILIDHATDSEIMGRTSWYKPIVPRNLPLSVKSAMTAAPSDSDPAWTAEEQAAAQQRIGIMSVEEVLF